MNGIRSVRLAIDWFHGAFISSKNNRVDVKSHLGA